MTDETAPLPRWSRVFPPRSCFIRGPTGTPFYGDLVAVYLNEEGIAEKGMVRMSRPSPLPPREVEAVASPKWVPLGWTFHLQGFPAMEPRGSMAWPPRAK